MVKATVGGPGVRGTDLLVFVSSLDDAASCTQRGALASARLCEVRIHLNNLFPENRAPDHNACLCLDRQYDFQTNCWFH